MIAVVAPRRQAPVRHWAARVIYRESGGGATGAGVLVAVGPTGVLVGLVGMAAEIFAQPDQQNLQTQLADKDQVTGGRIPACILCIAFCICSAG
jgi:hypothetical protein